MQNSADQSLMVNGVYTFDQPVLITDYAPVSGVGGDWGRVPSGWVTLGINSFGAGRGGALANPRHHRPPNGPRELSTVQILMEELNNLSVEIDAEYVGRFDALHAGLINQVSAFREGISANANMTSAQAAAAKQAFLDSKVSAMQSTYQEKTGQALSFYGKQPLYLKRELPARRLREILRGVIPGGAQAYDDSHAGWGHTLRAALERKYAARSVDALSPFMVAAVTDRGSLQWASSRPFDEAKGLLQDRLAALDRAVQVQHWRLPEYLRSQVSGGGGSSAEQMARSKQAADSIYGGYVNAVGKYKYKNPNILAPLSRPELEALQELVEGQANKTIGQRWADYHKSLLNSESARHLSEFSAAIAALQQHALDVEAQKHQVHQAHEAALDQAAELGAVQQVAGSFAGSKDQLERDAAAKRATLDSLLAAEVAAGRPSQGESSGGQQVMEGLLRDMARVNLLIADKTAANKLKASGNSSFDGFNVQTITPEEFRRYIESRAQTGGQARQLLAEWSKAYGDTLEAKFLQDSVTALEAISADLSARHAQQSWRLANGGDGDVPVETVSVSQATDAARLWSGATAGTSPGGDTSTWGYAKEVAKQLFIQAAVKSLGRNLSVAAAFYSPKLGNSDLGASVRSTGAGAVGVPPGVDLEFIASKNGTVDVAHRLLLEENDDSLDSTWVVADGVNVGSKVPVRSLTYSAANRRYEFVRDGESEPSIFWTPAVAPLGSSTVSPAKAPDLPVNPGSTVTPVSTQVGGYPDDPWDGLEDYILVFPADSGMEPIYVMFKSPRYLPGVVSGQGGAASADWELHARSGDGAGVPKGVADALRGRKYSSFKSFRRAVWREMSRIEEVGEDVSEYTIDAMRGGKSPYVPKSERVKGRERYELHHVDLISEGGEVYDIDNLRITSPRLHNSIHHQSSNQGE